MIRNGEVIKQREDDNGWKFILKNFSSVITILTIVCTLYLMWVTINKMEPRVCYLEEQKSIQEMNIQEIKIRQEYMIAQINKLVLFWENRNGVEHK